MELITLDLTCPSSHQLLRNSGGDSGPDLSFDKSASPKYLFSLARVSLAEASKPDLSFGWSGGDYTSSCPPSLVSAKIAYRADGDFKSGFFFIDRRAIPDAMVWRHPDAAIDYPRPAAGSFSMADVRQLSAYVIKLRDMPEGVLVLSGLSQVWKSRVCDPVLRGADRNGTGGGFKLFYVISLEEPHFDVRSTLQRLPFYGTPPAVADAVISDSTLEDLAVGIPSSKIIAKAEASQKRKASTFGSTSSHVAKRTRSSLAQSSGGTNRPSLFVGDDDGSDDDDDACVEIPLVTPLRFAAVIPFSGNQGGSSATLAAEGSNPRDSRGKGIMVDDADVPSVGASRPRPSSRPAPSFKDVSGDAIHTDFFPFSASPYYATYPEGGVAGNCEFTREEWDASYRPTFGVLTKEVFKDLAVCKTIVDHFPTPGEMVQVESLFDDQLTAKMTVLHCMMMWYGVSCLEEAAGSVFNDKLYSSDASFVKSKAKGKERKKKIKSLTKSLDNLHSEVARLSAALNQATVLEAEKDEEILRLKATPLEFSSFFRGQFQGLVQKFLASNKFSRVQGELLSLADSDGFERGLSMHRTKDEFAAVLKKMANFMPVILQLKPEKLVRSANVPASREVRVSPPTKESNVTPASKSLQLSANVNFTTSAVASEHNEEMVYAKVDGSDPKMTDDIVVVKSRHAFMQGISVAHDDAVEMVEVGRVSSGPNDVVVALSAGEKGDGLVPSSATGEEAAANSSGV
ncbi:hypothetical protein Tco_0656660 [Tanacetum coccineum]|uniref:Uncharacterized protein n=1 Tax=Tanacetum coccineum TaxID=301880 RepID=A0ABQ4XAN3_9ASTR